MNRGLVAGETICVSNWSIRADFIDSETRRWNNKSRKYYDCILVSSYGVLAHRGSAFSIESELFAFFPISSSSY